MQQLIDISTISLVFGLGIICGAIGVSVLAMMADSSGLLGSDGERKDEERQP